MELFEIIVGICSILSFLVSIFVASKVYKINNNFSVKGKDNVASGRDTTITR